MASTIEKYIQIFSDKKKSSKKDIVSIINKIKKKSKDLGLKGKVKLELEKAKLDLKKNYYKLGMHISKKFISENMKDFSYDDKFKELVDEIKNLQSYIRNLSNKQIKL